MSRLDSSLWNPDTEGVFANLPAADYHAAPGVSHSTLKHMEPTPAHCRVYMTEKREPSAAQILGTLTHSLILEPEQPLPQLAVKPEAMKFSTTEGKVWKKEAEEEGKLIVTTAEHDALNGMTREIAKHPYAARALANGQSELSLFSRAPYEPGLLRKCRIDFVPCGNALVDVKTCVDASPGEFSRTIFNFGYHTQAAWYLDLWNDLVPEEPKECFVFIAVEKTPPYAVAAYSVSMEALKHGRRTNMQRALRWHECNKSGEWPGYGTDCTEIDLPTWAYKKSELVTK